MHSACVTVYNAAAVCLLTYFRPNDFVLFRPRFFILQCIKGWRLKHKFALTECRSFDSALYVKHICTSNCVS